MKKLSKLVYLFIALVIMTSCEQETIESEELSSSAEIEALIQNYEFLSEAVDNGIDVQSYIESIDDISPQVNLSAKSEDSKYYEGNYLYVGECGTMIENDDRKNVGSMMYDIYDLMSQVCYESHEPRRRWERPYDAQKAFEKGMLYLVIRWAVSGQITWSEGSDIMKCAKDSNIDFEYGCEHDQVHPS